MIQLAILVIIINKIKNTIKMSKRNGMKKRFQNLNKKIIS